jgi:hypothetical protein
MRDEDYIIGLCDAVLKLKAQRQHRFGFLLGDPGKNGRRAHLPVDAYYEELRLVIEFRERQHSEAVEFFDKPGKLTCSGCHRGQQRALYEQRRRDILPQHGISVIELDYRMFEHTGRKRLTRNLARDEAVIREKLARFSRHA